VEQLDANQGKPRGRDRQAEASARQEHRYHRQCHARPIPARTGPARRARAHDSPCGRGEWEAAFRGGGRSEEAEVSRVEDVQHGRGLSHLPAGRKGRAGIVNYVLWIVQGLLALIFLFTGGTKLILPIEVLTEQTPLPGLFVRFLGVAEVLGAIGLILPGLVRVWPVLTPLAGSGLVIIMIGATVLTLVGVVPVGAAMALIPLVVGNLCAFVTYGRWRLVPLHGRSSRAQQRARSEASN